VSAGGPLGRLTRRSEFLNARKGLRAARPLVTVEARFAGAGGLVRVGFTATKRIGGAVVRNRAKRRLREAARQLLAEAGAAGCDYVFIARDKTADAPWAALLDDVRSALVRLRPALAAAETRSTAAPTPTGAKPRARPRLKDE
jgi:ribonuclease P protein component